VARPSNTALRRREIAEGLRRVMARSGFEAASIAEIARAASVPPGIVHYHFKDKREILLELLTVLAEEHDARLDRALAAAKPDARSRLRAFLDANLAIGKSADPRALACWVAACGEAIKDAKVRAAWTRAVDGSQRRLDAILRELRPKGGVEAAAAAIMAVIQGYLVLAATARDRIPRGSAAPSALAMAEGLLGPARPERGSGPEERGT
jgi:TetR/AcrR family transcriptional repressor of bet genes